MEKINIAELLKDCPKGMEFDCLLCNNPIELEDVVGNEAPYPIRAVGKDGFHHVFTAYGASYNHDDAKCVIFPKGKTTWEGFHRPFKDGDVVTSVFQGVVQGTGIFDYEEQSEAWIHACVNLNNEFSTDGYLGHVYDLRIATEEEKAKLFDAIKANGYKWNDENKTLEKIDYQYPKTYEECCDVLKIEYPYFKTEEDEISASTYKNKLFGGLKQLLICRDAYWKIAGEQMGLGKPWKPDWLNINQGKYVLYTHNNSICSNCFMLGNNILAFPTKEMRDAFQENFLVLIGLCKELL